MTKVYTKLFEEMTPEKRRIAEQIVDRLNDVHQLPRTDMTELPKMKPCPFCGSTAPVLRIDDTYGTTHASVWCFDCQAEGPDKTTRRGAIVAWNDRNTE